MIWRFGILDIYSLVTYYSDRCYYRSQIQKSDHVPFLLKIFRWHDVCRPVHGHRMRLTQPRHLVIRSSYLHVLLVFHFPGGVQWLTNPPASAGDTRDVGSIPGSGRSPEVENGHPLQHSCLENAMDRGTLWAAVHGVAESDTAAHTCTPLPSEQTRYCSSASLCSLGFFMFSLFFGVTVHTLHMLPCTPPLFLLLVA